jgi:hypothetical protein
MRSAIVFVATPANPYASLTDSSRIALAGHSLGSIVASFVQQDPDPGVLAIVALDTLRRWVNGDPGGAVFECTAKQGLEITPRVPALGFAKDQPCDARPDFAPPDLKLAGYEHWREAGIPAMELVMAGFVHADFAAPGSEDKHRDVAYFAEAWLDRWLLGDVAADDRLLADTVGGRPTASLLSTNFLSGAYLPNLVDSADYEGYLSDIKAPATKKKDGPEGEIGRDRARRGVSFRFAADDPTARFECRLDDAEWRHCKSPKRVGPSKLRAGRHVFRVRATDPRGNVERSPAVWRFRVTA